MKALPLAVAPAVLLVFGVLVAPAPARAGKCVVAAKAEYVDCKAECRDEFLVAKDACFNRDHNCVQACRAGREDCRAATGIDNALAACLAQLQVDKDNCRNQFPGNPLELDRCIDLAQIVAFQCRDNAREAARRDLRQCRKTFRQCVRDCPGAGPQVDPRQCKMDAKVAYKTCKVECREDFRLAKDACRNRDHECVDQCRSDRYNCRQPILVLLSADIAACNLVRDAAINACKLISDPDLRDQCIDLAQVAAFVCRDQARENARPGLRDCRLQFRVCVRACLPPG